MFRLRQWLLVCLLAVAGCAAAPDGSSLAGKLLVARPTMAPNLFSHTVVLLMNHDGKGAFGFILNRPGTEARLSDLMKELGEKLPERMAADPTLGLYLGGPVEIDTLYLLHSADIPAEESITSAGRYVLSKPLETMNRMARTGDVPKHAMLLLGYSGWGAGQLENELKRGDWEVIEPSDDLVFSGRTNESWEKAWERRAIGL